MQSIQKVISHAMNDPHLSFWRRTPSAAHFLPGFNTAPGAWLLGVTTVSDLNEESGNA